MRNVFIQTGNSKAFMAALARLNERGAGEACLMVVDGEPGLSKTRTALWFAVQQDAVLLRAKKEWTPPWMLRDLLTAISKEPPAHSFEGRYRQALQRLGQSAAEAAREKRTFAVVIDEADHIARSERLLDTLRDLSDMLEIPFVLVGMGRIRHLLARHPQVASRVGQVVEFTALSPDDTATLVNGLCEVEVEPGLVAFLHRVSGGYAREVKEGIAAIERFGRRNAGSGPVTLAAMAGQTLMVDRATGKDIKVEA